MLRTEIGGVVRDTGVRITESIKVVSSQLGVSTEERSKGSELRVRSRRGEVRVGARTAVEPPTLGAESILTVLP